MVTNPDYVQEQPKSSVSSIAWVKQIQNNPLLHALILSLAIIVCYYGLWNAYFWTDDFWMLGWVRRRASLGEAIWAQFGYSFRILLDVMLWLRVRLFDLNPAPYYWVSLLQHIGVTLLVYWLAAFWTQRRPIALLAALLFGTTFTHFEVTTWITGSNYSLAAIPYLAALVFFALFLQRRMWPLYLTSVVLFLVALLLTELAISLPLLLVAYHLILGRGSKPLRAVGLLDLSLHLPFWGLLAIYMAIQFYFIQSGGSEAAVADHAYRPGLHIIGNLFNLVYLVIPAYVPGFLQARLGQTSVWFFMVALAIIGHALALYGFWKGSAVTRFAIAFVYLTFLPYTLWEGPFSGAIRYRYLPAIGFSLLLALLLSRLHNTLRQREGIGYQRIVPAIVALLLVANVLFVQVWVQRHLENSAVRRVFVTQLMADYQHIQPETQIYIETSDAKFTDLDEACELIFQQSVHCTAFVSGEHSLDEVLANNQGQPFYWLQATPTGLVQLYPTAVD